MRLDRPAQAGAPVEPRAGAADADTKLFPEEGPAGGCASGECLPEAADSDEPEEAPAPSAALPAPSADRWRLAVDAVRSQSARHGASLAFGRLVAVKMGEVVLYYPPEQAFHRTTVTAQSGRALIEKALSEYYGRPTKLVLSETAPAGTQTSSVAEDEAKTRAARERSAEGQMRSHPAVRAVLKMLGGEIEHIRVLEKERPAASPADTADDGA